MARARGKREEASEGKVVRPRIKKQGRSFRSFFNLNMESGGVCPAFSFPCLPPLPRSVPRRAHLTGV